VKNAQIQNDVGQVRPDSYAFRPLDIPVRNRMEICYRLDLCHVDWQELKAALFADNFDNGRTPEQLRCSFQNSYAACIAWSDDKIVGTARVLSDGVCNAYLVDLWTLSRFRRQGIGRAMTDQLLTRLAGQHVYLQADDDLIDFYQRLGFTKQPSGLSRVVGKWLVNGPQQPKSEDSR
jgi:ribosomal protein S18 acetylase RimI-like enzyme